MSLDDLKHVEETLAQIESKTSISLPVRFVKRLGQIKLVESDDFNKLFYSFFSDEFSVLLYVYLHPQRTAETIARRTGRAFSRVKYILNNYKPIFIVESDGYLSHYSIDLSVIEKTQIKEMLDYIAAYYEKIKSFSN